jgi:hypothetical protein
MDAGEVVIHVMQGNRCFMFSIFLENALVKRVNRPPQMCKAQ